MKNRVGFFFLTSLVLCAIVCQMGALFVPSEQDATVLKRFLGTGFQVFNTTDSLLIGVGTDKVMANPAAPFNITDVVEDADLPSQRLRFWGRSDSLWFVYYEDGGIGHSWNLVLFSAVADSFVTLAAYWLLFNPVDDIHQLKSVIQKCRLYAFGQQWKRKHNQEIIIAVQRSDHRVYIKRR